MVITNAMTVEVTTGLARIRRFIDRTSGGFAESCFGCSCADDTAPVNRPSGLLLLLNESVSANCSVNLSVSRDGGDDHDDEQGSTAGMDPHQLLVGEVTITQAGALLGLSERQVWHLRCGFERDGPAALVHGNRGRPSSRRLPDRLRARIIELARTTYEGADDSHLAELLAEHEAIEISRASLQRLLRNAGLASPRRRRSPRHRSRRERMPQAGLLLQTDGSRHDWLEGRGPRLTLVGAIDDATGRTTAATFREQEDVAGYLIVLRETVRRHGVPLAVYRDRHTLFETPKSSLQTLEEQLADRRTPTQLGRDLAELGITSIAARSPQAKGRIERAWGTFQDRLVTELRPAGTVDRAGAEAVLVKFLPKFDRRFVVPAANPEPAWRPLPTGLRLDRVCCFKYRRVVANETSSLDKVTEHRRQPWHRLTALAWVSMLSDSVSSPAPRI